MPTLFHTSFFPFLPSDFLGSETSNFGVRDLSQGPGPSPKARSRKKLRILKFSASGSSLVPKYGHFRLQQNLTKKGFSFFRAASNQAGFAVTQLANTCLPKITQIPKRNLANRKNTLTLESVFLLFFHRFFQNRGGGG